MTAERVRAVFPKNPKEETYIGDCREQLGRFEGKDSSASALHEDIEWLLNEAEADLAYYRQIKADIAEVGIEEALRHSSRKVK